MARPHEHEPTVAAAASSSADSVDWQHLWVRAGQAMEEQLAFARQAARDQSGEETASVRRDLALLEARATRSATVHAAQFAELRHSMERVHRQADERLQALETTVAAQALQSAKLQHRARCAEARAARAEQRLDQLIHSIEQLVVRRLDDLDAKASALERYVSGMIRPAPTAALVRSTTPGHPSRDRSLTDTRFMSGPGTPRRLPGTPRPVVAQRLSMSPLRTPPPPLAAASPALSEDEVARIWGAIERIAAGMARIGAAVRTHH